MLFWPYFGEIGRTHPNTAIFGLFGIAQRFRKHRYRSLEEYASQVDQWPHWRAKALEYLRSRVQPIKSSQESRHYSWARNIGHSELVEIFLWENDVEAAWREACEGGCSDSLWMRLAEKRKDTHPKDVIPIYKKPVERTIDRKDNESYRDAVELLKVIEALMTELQCKAEFSNYLWSVRAAHKPKRNLMKLLQSEWS